MAAQLFLRYRMARGGLGDLEDVKSWLLMLCQRARIADKCRENYMLNHSCVALSWPRGLLLSPASEPNTHQKRKVIQKTDGFTKLLKNSGVY